jgi:hypothetical protein
LKDVQDPLIGRFFFKWFCVATTFHKWPWFIKGSWNCNDTMELTWGFCWKGTK